MTIRRTLIASLIATILLASPILAEAAVLGEISSLSPIGAPLRIEISTQGGRASEVGACLRVVTPPNGNNDLPTIRRGRISAVGSGVNATIVVSSPDAMQHPIAQLTIENTCESRLRRTYTLLFPYPSAPTQASAASKADAPRGPAAKPADGRQWTTAPGESLSGIARALYPDNPGARRTFIRKTVQANPGRFPNTRSRTALLPPGTRLSIPNLADISRSSAPASTRRSTSAPSGAAASSTQRRMPMPSVQTGDRLVVAPDVRSSGTDARSGDISAGIDRQLTGASSREEEISAAIDRSIVTQMELLARIKELEQIQSRLMERAAQIGVA
ncbi:hypothetical protein J5J83_19630, partial [Azoarcus sp. L1K30]|uniref:type IV pilus assembly protein FimV n=1 Tax=Azoarcus sp. L1K30 TaxID=2820277 RepID=UPI001B83EC2B